MVGIEGVTVFESGRGEMFCLCCWLLNGDCLRSSGFISASLGFQFVSKLTIGLPGLSLTAVGVGSLGLLSFRRMLVACRISSLLISNPSFIGISGAGVSAVLVGEAEFAVYAGFLD